MDINNIKQLFPNLEESLYGEIVNHGTIKELKAGETLLKVGQTIRSTMLILNGVVKLYREDDWIFRSKLSHYSGQTEPPLIYVLKALFRANKN